MAATTAATTSTSSWTGWFTRTSAAAASAAGANVDLRFPSDQGLITVREESRLTTHAGGAATRARCTAGSGREFDVHRLRLAPKGGAGFVTLADLEALTLEVELMREVGAHPNVLQCFSSLVENEGGVHCRVLLCDPCSGSLRCTVDAEGGGALPLSAAVGVGTHLSLGLGHLHSLSILYGGMRPEGVFRGQDGCWKLADFSRSVRMPVTLGEWRELQPATFAKGANQALPPELSAAPEETDIDAVVDVWFLGLLLAKVILGHLPGGVVREVGQELLASASSLENQLYAHFWTLLHLPLAAEPTDRPKANEIASLMSAAAHMLPTDVLEDMPPRVRSHCLRAATGTARQLAVELLVEQAATAVDHMDILERAASRNLQELAALLPDATRIETLCGNFGFSSSAPPKLSDDEILPENAHDPASKVDESVVPQLIQAARTEPQKQDLSWAAAHDDQASTMMHLAGKESQTTSSDGCSTDDCWTSSGEADSQSSGSNSRSTSPCGRSPRASCTGSNTDTTRKELPDLIDLGLPDLIDL